MFSTFPMIGEPLASEHVAFLKTLSKSCRNAIVAMTSSAQSGHPGGSCSVIDMLSVLYAFVVSQTGEDVVVSNGHVSPAVYSVLSEMGWIPRDEVVRTFRKAGSIYEGHVTRHVRGVHYGTGPLGIGVSVASAFALTEKLNKTGRHVFALSGDGESQEGQVYEMMHFASKYHLNNLTVFVDYNEVQLSDALEKIMPIDLPAIYRSAHWNVLEIDGHDYSAVWDAIGKAYKSDRPTAVIAHTVMGKGVSFMEPDGLSHKATWHGVAPKKEVAQAALEGELKMTGAEVAALEGFRKLVKWNPPAPDHVEPLTPMKDVNPGKAVTLAAGTITDCRSAYGNALKDLADLNPTVLAMTADLGESVKTHTMA